MLWYYIRVVITFTFPLYHRKIGSKNLKNFRVKNPVLIACNHPNAFMDPVLLSWILHYPRSYYMARGDAFKKGIITRLLQNIGIIPIFRMQDAGIEGLRKNAASFQIAYKMWAKGAKIMVFPEGICIQERRLRPLQKGTARMAFGFMEETGRNDFLIIPVSVNYSNPSKPRGYVYFQAGEPIEVRKYFEIFKENNAKAVNSLTKDLEERMKELTPHFNDKANDELIEQLQEVYKKQWMEKLQLNYHSPEDQQKYWFHLSSVFNKTDKTHQSVFINLREQCTNYYKQLHQLGLRDHLIRKEAEGKHMNLALASLLFVLGFPFYLIGKLLNAIPQYLGKKAADKKCKNKEFYASVNFAVSSFVLKFMFLIELLIVWLLFKDAVYLLFYTAIKVSCGLIGLRFSPFRKKYLGTLRLKKLKKRQKELLQSLIQQRSNIISSLNQLEQV